MPGSRVKWCLGPNSFLFEILPISSIGKALGKAAYWAHKALFYVTSRDGKEYAPPNFKSFGVFKRLENSPYNFTDNEKNAISCKKTAFLVAPTGIEPISKV